MRPRDAAVGPSKSTDCPVVRRADGRRIAYATYGDSDGTPLVFLHGTPGSRVLGRLLGPAARRAGVRVIAPDRPGYGRSDPPADDARACARETISALADAVDEDRVDVAAFSGGAPVALASATAAPERVGAVDLVAGSAPTSFVDEPATVHRVLGGMAGTVPSVLGACLRLQAALAGRVPGLAPAELYAAEDVSVPAVVESALTDDFREAVAGGATGAVVDARRQREPWPVDLQAIDRPVRQYHGTADHLVSIESARRVADAVTEATLTELEGVGHLGALLEYREAIEG